MNKCRKWLSLAICLALLCMLLPRMKLTVHAEVISGYCGAEYDDEGNYGRNLTWTLDRQSGALTIMGRGAMANYTWNDQSIPWYDYRVSIRTISLPAGLTNIGGYVFYNCTSLTSVTIPDGVTDIGGYAFSNCTSLTSVTIPGSVTSVGYYAFSNCICLTSVTIPEGVTIIGDSAFLSCSGLTSITIPNSVTHIGEWAFRNCSDLYRVNITDLGAWCKIEFEDYYSNPTCYAFRLYLNGKILKDATLPEGLTSIRDYAFVSCSGLTSVTIPEGVTSIGDSAFSRCSGLTSVTIPEGVISISDSAFSDCFGLTSVTIPSSLINVGYEAFSGCYSLTNASINAKNIGKWFSFNSSLQTVTFGPNVTSIGKGAFAYCTSLSRVSLPASLEIIRQGAFFNCGLSHALYATDKVVWEDVLIESENDTLTDAPYFHYNATDWDSHVTVKSGAPATCTEAGNVTYTCPCGYEWTEEQSALGHDYVDGRCSRCGMWNPELNPFGDVQEGKYYYNAVLWAITREPPVTNGTDDTHFSPNKTCTRGQVVTFLWNALGQPEPDLNDNPFVDVKPGKYYTKPVLWAYQTGVTTGTDATHFNPNGECTRGQVVTFLWKAMGQPEPQSSNNPFADVKDGKFYYKAVLWAVENGITNGTSATTFSPNKVCTRGQVVTFLYNTLA